MPGPALLRRLTASRTGVSITEFGLIAPVFMVMMMGVLDVCHTLYVQSVLQGAVQKAARDSSLETGGTSAVQTAMDTAITDQVKRLASNATVTITRTSFRDYTKAAVRAKEPFTDATSGTYANGICDHGEPYEDNNDSGSWDVDNGRTGQGGAKDTVILSTQVVYPRIFPFMKTVGLPANVTVSAATVLANQPFGDQAAVTVRNCP
ncbi:TadE/TadG family type IV pilus assembly protein [Sphingobium sp. AN641]|uniref:TadE/TadG family type IV pilus assembly protein n=1 Tax=Sphingobium sp. AN641 TaxID=3133443 RepID=UPI0030BC7EB6